MKKVILIASLCFISVASIAQTTFGIQVGANMADAKVEATSGGADIDLPTDSKFGFLIGALAEVPLSANLSFRPELNFIQKGFENEQTESMGGITYTEKSDVTMNFIEIPLNLVYNFGAGPGRFFVGAGPSIGFGISGKNKYTASGTGFPTVNETTDIKFDGKKDATDDNEHLKSLDFGANLLIGYKLPMGVSFALGYTQGFSNLSPHDNTSLKTSGLSLKVAYTFGGGAAAE